jgi:hypothetical protein
MSYCRFSSDDFRCDVYAYEHCYGGFMVHVAGNKTIGYVPRVWHPPRAWITERAESGWRMWRYKAASHLSWATYRLQMLYLERAPRRDLGLAHDGESFCEPDAGACADRLLSLRDAGYRVPQYAIDALRMEGEA